MKVFSLVICFFIAGAMSAQKFDDVLITTHKLNDQVSVLFGAGGNIAVFYGPDGVLMIDDQFAELSDKINEAIDSITTQEVRYVVNTHWHGDHTGGNLAFAEDGAVIVAHKAVKERLSTDQIRPFKRSAKAAPKLAWPSLTFDEEMQLEFNGEKIHLLHVHNAHTDGDAFVYFPSHNILHMGDCFFRNKFPYIDLDSGGSPEGAIAAVEAAIMICDEGTQIIPGHGAIANKEDLKRYHQMLKIITDRVEKAISNGATKNNLPVASLTEGFDTWGDGFISAETFTKTLYKAYEIQKEAVAEEVKVKRKRY